MCICFLDNEIERASEKEEHFSIISIIIVIIVVLLISRVYYNVSPSPVILFHL